MSFKLKSVFVFLYSLFCTSQSNYEVFTQGVPEAPGRINDIGACYSLDTIMNTFNKAQYRSLPQVVDLLEAYKYNCRLRDLNSLPKQHIFIALEAPRRRKRYMLAKRLAKLIGGAMLFSPPMGWDKFRGFFNKSVEMRRAFHSLTLYGSANNARQYLGRRPVVMAGYWMDQATFSIAKKFYPDFPPPDAPEMQWPKDLLKPDYTFFINEPFPRAFLRNVNESIRYQILQVYRMWKNPPAQEFYMDDEIPISAVVDDMVDFIKNSSFTPMPTFSKT